MKMLKKLELVLAIFAIITALICGTNAQGTTENIATFFDSEIPGIMVQVNATKETQPTQNITIMLSLTREADVQVEVESFNLNVYGFLHDKDKVSMGSISDAGFTLDGTPRVYVDEFPVPENVSGSTYGEFTIVYVTTYTVGTGHLELPYNLTIGFTMTNVENVYLKTIEEKLQNLTTTFEQLNQTFWESFQMNLTNENLAKLKGSIVDLDNTRRLAVVLGIIAFFFVATTIYLVMQKPKQYW